MISTYFDLSVFICLCLPAPLISTAEPVTNATSAMVVTATREKRLIDRTPYSVDSIDDAEIRMETAARNVPEMLKYQPGILVQKTGHGQGSPYIRGFTGFRNLLMIDGIRLNNSVFRDGPNQYWNTIDSLGISRLETVRGPFSVLYGSDAIGGTVNVITRGAYDMHPDSNWDRSIYYRFSSAENSQVARLESSGYLTDNMVLSAGYTIKDFGDLRGGRAVGLQDKTGYDELDWDAKIEFFPADNTEIVLAHQSVDIDDAWRTHKTVYGIDWEGLSVGNELRRILDQDRQLTYLQYHQYLLDGLFHELHAGISHHYQKEERDRLRSRARHDLQGFDVHTLGAFLMFRNESSLGQWIYGSEYYHDSVSSYKKVLNPDGSLKSAAIQGPVADDAAYETLGTYIQNELAVTERAQLIMGLRHEYAAANADSVQDPDSGTRISISDNWSSVVGSLRGLYHLDRAGSCNLFAGISQGFRTPNLSDLTRLDSARTDEIETPAPGLDPETYISYEAGIKVRSERFTGQAAYFYNDIRDMIVRTPTGKIIDGENEVTKRNSGNGFLHGVEFEGRYRIIDSLTVSGIFTWMDGEVYTYPSSDPVSVREPVDRLMPATARAALRKEFSGKLWIEASCTIAGDADNLSTRDKSDTSRIPPGGTPGYTVYDIRCGWRVAERMMISAALENLTDEDYRIHGSGLNESGLNLIIAVESSF